MTRIIRSYAPRRKRPSKPQEQSAISQRIVHSDPKRRRWEIRKGRGDAGNLGFPAADGAKVPSG
jgi:hypothetical protein